jgi:hypothetical protein
MSEAMRSLWELLLLTSNNDVSAQLTCEECFVLLEYDAELLSDGASPNQFHPMIRKHLSLCSKCKVKIEEWLERKNMV